MVMELFKEDFLSTSPPHSFPFLKISNKIAVNLMYFPSPLDLEHNCVLCITGNRIKSHQNDNNVGK